MFTSFSKKRKFLICKKDTIMVYIWLIKFLFNNYTIDIFLFNTAIILLVVTSIVICIICKHRKLKSLVTSLTLQQIREVGMIAKQELVSIMHDVECTCKIQCYTIFMLSLAVLGIIIFIILNARKLKL